MRRLCLGLLLSCALAVAAQTHESGEHGDPLAKWKWINFGILSAGLGYLIAKHGGPFFRNRAASITHDIEGARREKAESDARAAAIEKRIANLGAEVEVVRANAKQEMEAEAARIQGETRRLAAKLEEQAAQEIEFMGKQAAADLRAHAARLALHLAEQKVKTRMNPETQSALVSRFVSGLKESAN